MSQQSNRCGALYFVVHPTGNQFVRALIQELNCIQAPLQFWTTIGFGADQGQGKWVPRVIKEAMERRRYAMPSKQMVRFPWREGVRLLTQKLGMRFLSGHEQGWASTDAVYRALDLKVAKHLEEIARHNVCQSVHAYEDGAAAVFAVGQKLGIRCSYELPIAYWETSRKLLANEATRYPEWEPTLGATRDTDEKCERKTNEIALADAVACPSRFVADSVPEAQRSKCYVTEFGSPVINSAARCSRSSGKVLRVLFAGTMTQRKGLADVFASMKLLRRSDVRLIVMGSPVVGMDFYHRQYADFEYEQPRSHARVLELMSTCDVLVLPSIIEGRALVQQEALSCGLPLVVTRNAGGEDLIDEGKTGFLVPVGSPDCLAEKISWIADHREALEGMREAAVKKAAGYRWKAYAQKIIKHGLSMTQ